LLRNFPASFHGRCKFEFSCTGSQPRNVPARDQESFPSNFAVVPLKISLCENSNKLLNNSAPVGKLLSKNTSREKHSVEKMFWRDSVWKFLSKGSILLENCCVGALFRGKLSVLKLLSVLAEPFRFFQKEVLHVTKFVLQNKTKRNMNIQK
jgi:hypothetical protein